MLKLNSEDLPLVAAPKRRGAPTARLWSGVLNRTAPLCRIDLFAKYGQFAHTTPVGVSTSSPDYVGQYYRLDLGAKISAIAPSTDFQFPYQKNPLNLVPDSYWIDGQTLNLYTQELNQGSELVINAIVLLTCPLADSDLNYSLNIPANLTVTQVNCQGLVFTSAASPSSPQSGEFVQTDTTLKLYGSITYAPQATTEVQVQGIFSIELPSPTSTIATFDTSEANLLYVSGMDYMGQVFIPANNLYKPLLGEFLWKRPLLHLFLDYSVGRAIVPKSRIPGAYQSKISSITYQGVV